MTYLNQRLHLVQIRDNTSDPIIRNLETGHLSRVVHNRVRVDLVDVNIDPDDDPFITKPIPIMMYGTKFNMSLDVLSVVSGWFENFSADFYHRALAKLDSVANADDEPESEDGDPLSPKDFMDKVLHGGTQWSVNEVADWYVMKYAELAEKVIIQNAEFLGYENKDLLMDVLEVIKKKEG